MKTSAIKKSAGKKGKKKNTSPAYATYIRKLLDQGIGSPDVKLGISGIGIDALSGLIVDVQERLIDQSAKLARYQKKATLSTKHLHAAATLVMPSDLAKDAMKDASRFVSQYASAVNDAAKKKK